MAANRDPIIVKEKKEVDGSITARVQFFVSGNTLPREIDSKIGERTFRIDSGAQKVLQQVNENLSAALRSLGSKGEDVTTFDVGMAIYLYTRKNKAPDLPTSEILIDGNTMKTLAKKFLR